MIKYFILGIIVILNLALFLMCLHLYRLDKDIEKEIRKLCENEKYKKDGI